MNVDSPHDHTVAHQTVRSRMLLGTRTALCPMTTRILKWVLVVLEFFLVVLLVAPRSIHSQSHLNAFRNFHENPNPETERTWHSENSKLKRQIMMIDGTVIMIALANGGAIFWLARKTRRKHAKPSEKTL